MHVGLEVWQSGEWAGRQQHSPEAIRQYVRTVKGRDSVGVSHGALQGDEAMLKMLCTKFVRWAMEIHPLPGELDGDVTGKETDGAPVDKDPVV